MIADLPTPTEATEARRDMCRQRLVIAERNATGELHEDVQMALATCDRPDLSPGDWKALEGLSLRLLLRSIVSLAVVVPVWLTVGQGAGDPTQLRALPWWVVLGGTVGVVFVAGSVLVGPSLGLALFFVCVVAGQLVGATVVDHLGAFGVPTKPVNAMKIVGIVLVLIGAALVQRGGR